MVQLSQFVYIGLINLLILLIADFIYVQLGQQSSHRCFDYLLLISQYVFWLWGTTTLFKHFSFCKKMAVTNSIGMYSLAFLSGIDRGVGVVCACVYD